MRGESPNVTCRRRVHSAAWESRRASEKLSLKRLFWWLPSALTAPDPALQWRSQVTWLPWSSARSLLFASAGRDVAGELLGGRDSWCFAWRRSACHRRPGFSQLAVLTSAGAESKMCPFPAGEVLPRKQGASHCCGARRKQNGQAPNAKHQTHPPVHTIQLPTFIWSTGVSEGLNTLAALQLQGIAEQSSWRRSIRGRQLLPAGHQMVHCS